jgi:hypothetical protein
VAVFVVAVGFVVVDEVAKTVELLDVELLDVELLDGAAEDGIWLLKRVALSKTVLFADHSVLIVMWVLFVKEIVVHA